jgi:hypothetical protein
MIKGSLAKSKPRMKRIPKGGPLGLPTDFQIAPDGNVLACQYGSHADDQWSVDDLLNLVRR